MAISNPNTGRMVYVTARPQLRGEIVEVVSPEYVKVQFPTQPEPIGVATDRLSNA